MSLAKDNLPMSLRAYARRRGCTLRAVQKAIADDRLKGAVGQTAAGVVRIEDPAEADRLWSENTNPERVPIYVRAKREKGAKAEPAKRRKPEPPPRDLGRRETLTDDEIEAEAFAGVEDEDPEGVDGELEEGEGDISQRTSIAAAQRIKVIWSAKRERLRYERDAGKLVDAAEVKAEAFRFARIVRDNLLNVADRLAAQIAAEQDPARVHELLDVEIRKALEGLAEAPAEQSIAEAAE